MQLAYWLPILQIGLGNLHVPGPALIAPAFALYAFSRLRGSPVVVPETSAFTAR